MTLLGIGIASKFLLLSKITLLPFGRDTASEVTLLPSGRDTASEVTFDSDAVNLLETDTNLA